MKMFVFAALVLPSLTFASECKIVSSYQGGGTTSIESHSKEVEKPIECMTLAVLELGKTKVVRVHRPRGGSRRVTVRVNSADIKTTFDGVRYKGTVSETRRTSNCQVKELVRMIGNDWEATEFEDLSQCVQMAQSKLGTNSVKFKLAQDGILFSGKLKNLVTK